MTTIDMKPMKVKALGFPEPVKSLILSEPDSLPLQDFLAKSGVWERLLKMSQKQEVTVK
jgi:hypothetical protein